MKNENLIQTNQALVSTQTAQQIVQDGADKAKQLMEIVNKKEWAKDIQGKRYLQVEAWQTLGKFYGLTAKTKSTEYVEMGAIKGFNAVVEILDSTGQVIGGAEAGCYSDEKRWNTEAHVNNYGKTIDGAPLFTLKSMAQTRATGKAYRLILSWVAVLAGFEPTPAEEMDGVVIQKPLLASQPTTQVVQPVTHKFSALIEKFHNAKVITDEEYEQVKNDEQSSFNVLNRLRKEREAKANAVSN